MSVEDKKVRENHDINIPTNQDLSAIYFREFVVIKSTQTADDTTTAKAINSYIEATAQHPHLSPEDSLTLWVITMTDNELTVATRRRYFGCISTLYTRYCDEMPVPKDDTSTINRIRRLCEVSAPQHTEALHQLNSRLTANFSTLLQDAATRPALAIFLTLLLTPSADLKEAVSLKIDPATASQIANSITSLPQLDSLIATSDLHHRRRYLFPLSQSQKRLPQLIGETCTAIDGYLNQRRCAPPARFTPDILPALWIAKARESGIGIPEIRSIVSTLPAEYCHYLPVKPAHLTAEEKGELRLRVANAYCPTAPRWYAVKLRRGVACDDLLTTLREEVPAVMQSAEHFYPLKETVRREGKKIIKEKTPYLPDILFIRVRPAGVAEIDRVTRMHCAGWVYRLLNTPDSEYSVIDHNSMRTFQNAVGQFTADMHLELTDRLPAGIGRRVRITGGVMAGYEGMIYDIKEKGCNGRTFYLRLSCSQYMKLEAEVEERYIELLETV